MEDVADGLQSHASLFAAQNGARRDRVSSRLPHEKMLILFAIRIDAIRGFAITISMGILISMFTAIVLVWLRISHWLKRTRPKLLRIGNRWHIFPEGTAIPFIARATRA
jgi:hypothetical protein